MDDRGILRGTTVTGNGSAVRLALTACRDARNLGSFPHVPEILVIGRTFAHYEIAALLGKGGMGEVYRARDQRLHRDVAIKVLPPDVAEDSGRLLRFEREARLLASLQHQNVASIYGLEESDGLHFLVLELVDGEQLQDRMRRGPIPVDQVVSIGREIAIALEAAHSKGVIHRDLKPSNVMISQAGQVKVLDFGLACSVDVRSKGSSDDLDTVAIAADLTRAGVALGTPAYMSPEQALGRDVDSRGDLFSLGIILYEMATGAHPFRDLTDTTLLDAILNATPAAPSSIREDVPAQLESLVRALLSKDRDDRPAGASEVIALLALDAEVAGDSRDQTIAVLPFSNLSADPENEFLADGMADEIITALTKIESLRVLSRTSSFAFKGRSEDVREIARALDVSVVLEGSLRRSGNRIRVATQLVNASDGYHLWSERFDREIEDVFAVQDEIAAQVASALRIVLTGREERALRRLPTDDLEAYELYLRGRLLLDQFTEKRFVQAREYFRSALEHDEDFLPAWVGLAESAMWIFQWGVQDRDEADLRTAIEAGQRALTLAPDRAEAHAAAGFGAWLQDDVPEAVAAFERAQQLDPRMWEAAYFLARLHVIRHEYSEAVRQYLIAADIRPDDYQSPCLAVTLMKALGRQDERRRLAERVLPVLERHVVLYPDDARAHYLGTTIQHIAGNTPRAREWAKRAEELAPDDGGVRYNIACFHLELGENDAALDLLEAGVETGWGNRSWLEGDPDMDPVREDPRFKALLDRIEK
jgi:non-specific serine/threonine protein kinase